MLLDIVILPPPHIAQMLVRKLKRANKGFRPVYLVGSSGLAYHSSLFFLNVNQRRLPDVMRKAGEAAREFPKIKFSTHGAAHDNDGVWVTLSRPRALVRFKDRVIASFAPLRQAAMPYTSSYQLTPLRKFYRQRFGVHYTIGRFYRPHFTLAKYQSHAEARAVALRLRSLSFRFTPGNLAVAEVNRYHQVTRIIKRFKV